MECFVCKSKDNVVTTFPTNPKQLKLWKDNLNLTIEDSALKNKKLCVIHFDPKFHNILLNPETRRGRYIIPSAGPISKETFVNENESEDLSIKLDPYSKVCCVACLKSKVQTFNEHEINTEIMSIYKELLKDHVSQLDLDGVAIEICFECMEMLNRIRKFKSKCVNSIEILTNRTASVFDEFTDDMSMNDFCSSFIKIEEEEEMIVADLQLKVEHPLPQLTNLKENSEKPKKTAKSKTMNNTKSPVASTSSQRGYCHICCCNQLDSHAHVLIAHSRQFEDGTLRCLLCNEVCHDARGLLLHQESKHKEYDQPKKCGKCEMESKSREEFVKHVNITHYSDRKMVYPCDFCNSVFYKTYTHKYHTWTHFGKKRFVSILKLEFY